MTPGHSPDDVPRDEHLRAALRHAPDADLQPPAHLRAQIVAAAHRAVGEPAPVAAPRPRRWWSPGPLGASGAFASVLLAGFIGLMWGDSPPGPGVDTPEPAPALSPAPAPAPVTVPTPAPPASPTPASPPQAVQMPQAAPATIPPPKPQREQQAEAAPSPPAVADAARSAEPAAKAMPLPDAPAPRLAASMPVPALSSAPMAPVPAAPPAPAFEAPAAALGAAEAARPPPVHSAPAAARSTMPGMSLRQFAAPPLAAATAGEAASWRWRVDGIDQGTATTEWRQAASGIDRLLGQPSGLLRLPEARRIELRGPAGEVDRLWLSPAQLLWCPGDGSGCRLSTMDAGAAAQLLQQLPAPDQTPNRDSR